MVKIAHLGPPCDPPVVHGHEFKPIEDGYYLADVPENVAEELLRVPAFRQFGGQAKVPEGAKAPAGEPKAPKAPKSEAK